MAGEAFVSVVIPALDAGAVIRNSVTSVLGQSHTNLEIVVVDNGSSDDTCDIVRELSRVDSRVRLVESGRTGVSRARNVGIEAARGDYLAFCDADDEMEQDALSSLLGKVSAADIVAGGMSFDVINGRRENVSSWARQVAIPLSARGGELGELFENLWDNNYLQSCCSKLYSVDFLRKNCVRFDEGLSSYEDLSFVLDCLARGASFAAVPDICYRYLRSASGSNSTRYKPDMTDQMERVSERVVSFYEEVLGRYDDDSCTEHVVQLLVVTINNAQGVSRDMRAQQLAVADALSRDVFKKAVSNAVIYPNRYSNLVCWLGSRGRFGLVVLLARIRNLVRSKRAAR